MTHDCTDCGRPARKGGRQCARCYQKRYRATPEGKRHHNDAVIRYNARHPDKHLQWSRTWQFRTGANNRVPADLQDFRRAIKTLEQALASAEKHQRVRPASERGGDPRAEC